MVIDSLSNFIIKLKNASLSKKDSVTVSYSKILESVAHVLVKEGFIASAEKKGKGVDAILEVSLRYENKSPAINDVQRISKLSKRLYVKSKELFPVKSGYGILVLTTPKGIMSDREAKKLNVGGEPLFKIW